LPSALVDVAGLRQLHADRPIAHAQFVQPVGQGNRLGALLKPRGLVVLAGGEGPISRRVRALFIGARKIRAAPQTLGSLQNIVELAG